MLLSGFALGQKLQFVNSFGFQWQRGEFTLQLTLPTDTSFLLPNGSIAFKNHILFVKDTTWKVAGGGNGNTAWGNIVGNINNQTDLITALAAKQNALPTGSSAQYWNALGQLRTFSTDVRSVTDPLYSLIGHTHNPNDITNLTSYIRGTISVTGNGTYNSATGVIN